MRYSLHLLRSATMLAALAALLPTAALAEVSLETQYITSSLLLLIGAFLVMFMAAGFCALEAGFVRTTAVSTICTKNVGLYAICGLAYAFVGYELMFGIEKGGWLGHLKMWGVDDKAFIDHNGVFIGTESGKASGAVWIYQSMFVATVVSIVSGAVAERTRLWSFFVFSAIVSAFIYPIAASWVWGGGWLGAGGFSDFAGSALVHSLGGWCALTGIWLIGARQGRFTNSGKPIPMPGSNLPLATLGTFILWMCWFGFNGASVGSLASAKDAAAVATVFVNTNIAACAGAVAAMFYTQVFYKKIDLTIALNGALAGLVSITAEPLSPSIMEACLVGAVGAILMALTVTLLDRLKLDDVVGAVPVHLAGGIWGTMAVPISNPAANFMTQGVGVVAIAVFGIVTSLLTWSLIKIVMGLRISDESEEIGIDRAEVGLDAYPEFVRASSKM